MDTDCTKGEFATCEEGAHSYSWPCDYALGTGRLADTEAGRQGREKSFSVPAPAGRS